MENISLVPTRQGTLDLGRRQVLIGGTLLVGVSAVQSVANALQMPSSQGPPVGMPNDARKSLPSSITSKDGGSKPVILPKMDSTDPVAYSLAENLFWTDILAEHARFFVMLMPGPELQRERSQAEQFQSRFTEHFRRVQTAPMNRGNYANLNRQTTEMVKPFVDFKDQMFKAQKDGRLRSLVWPTFFDHTAREAERFSKRLDTLSQGSIVIDRTEAVDFWTKIMGEHADFIAHLLDPEEATLINKALQTSQAFRAMREGTPATPPASTQTAPSKQEAVDKAVNDIIDFKTVAAKGIEAGQIKSIIHPTLADHVRREAVKCADELKRAA
jgi:hypothetical protein